MKLQTEVAGEPIDITLTREGESIRASVGGREYELVATEPENGVHLLKHDGRVFEATVSGDRTSYSVDIGGHNIDVILTDPKRLRSSAGADHHAEGRAEVKTAMPGKIVRLVVATGEAVKKGDPVIVVEAMKMQNEIKSPKDGVVAEIRVAEGDTVSAGDVLMVIE